ncbi:helix-turn-helix transcriptional regulator [Streptomyces zhihengii]
MVRYADEVVSGGRVAPLVADTVARLVAVTALDVFPSSFAPPGPGGRGPGAVGPAAVRRAVDHIHDHAARALTLADLAQAAGVTGRALQYGFARHLNTSPMAYLRRVRLERAHAELAVAEHGDGTTVAAVAARWGGPTRATSLPPTGAPTSPPRRAPCTTTPCPLDDAHPRHRARSGLEGAAGRETVTGPNSGAGWPGGRSPTGGDRAPVGAGRR